MNPSIHPIRLFPRMLEEALNRLAEDMRRRGSFWRLEAEAKARMREGAGRSRGAQICAPLERPPRRRKITAAGYV